MSALLEQDGTNEQAIVDELGELLGSCMSKMPSSIDRSVKHNFTDYEALIVARERLPEEEASGGLTAEGNMQLDMRNDLVHMNDCVLFCFNPYVCEVWPPVFASLLEEVRRV